MNSNVLPFTNDGSRQEDVDDWPAGTITNAMPIPVKRLMLRIWRKYCDLLGMEFRQPAAMCWTPLSIDVRHSNLQLTFHDVLTGFRPSKYEILELRGYWSELDDAITRFGAGQITEAEVWSGMLPT